MAFWDGARWIRPGAGRNVRGPAPRRLRDWLATLVMLVSLVMVAVPLRQSNAALPVLSITPSAVPAGTRVTAAGTGLPAKASVRLLLDGVDFGSTTRVSPTGSLKSTFVVPQATTGHHTVTAVAFTSGRKAGKQSLVLGAVLAAGTLTITAPAQATIAPTAAPPSPSPTATAPPSPTPAPSMATTPTRAPSTATPSATSSPPAADRADAGFVAVCGRSFCVDGQRWYLYGASTSGGLENPLRTVKLAQAAGLNSIRIAAFLHEERGSDPYEEARWRLVDGLLAAAGAADLKVDLDLSTYRNYLHNSGKNPYTYDWGRFVAFVVNRVNTISGMRYGDDPAIAFVEFAPEVDGIIGNPDPLSPTTAELTDFFRRTYAQWRAGDANHLISSGGLLQYGWNSGIDWRAIFGSVDFCSVHVYSETDIAALAAVAAYCEGIGKPWLNEEFGFPQDVGDAVRAAAYQRQFDLAKTGGAAGTAFWNIGEQLTGVNYPSQTYDVNPQTPKTWAVVVANAP